MLNVTALRIRASIVRCRGSFLFGWDFPRSRQITVWHITLHHAAVRECQEYSRSRSTNNCKRSENSPPEKFAKAIYSNLSWRWKFIADCSGGRLAARHSCIGIFASFSIQSAQSRNKKPDVPKKYPKRAQLIRINKTSLTWSWILVFYFAFNTLWAAFVYRHIEWLLLSSGSFDFHTGISLFLRCRDFLA